MCEQKVGIYWGENEMKHKKLLAFQDKRPWHKGCFTIILVFTEGNGAFNKGQRRSQKNRGKETEFYV